MFIKTQLERLILISFVMMGAASAILKPQLPSSSTSVLSAEQALSILRSAGRASLAPTPPDKRLLLETIYHPTTAANQRKATGASIDDREPSWWDACSRRLSLNDTLINIMIGPQARHSHQAPEEERQQRARLAQWGGLAIHASRPEGPLLVGSRYPNLGSRRRRSPAGGLSLADVDQSENQIGYLAEDETGGFLFDSRKQQIRSERWSKSVKGDKHRYGIKKTTFSMLNANKHSLKKQRYYHSLLAGQQESPLIPVRGDTTLASSTSEIVAGETQIQLAQVNKIPALKTILESIAAQDIRMSWQINCALNAANSVRRLIAYVQRLISRQHHKPEQSESLEQAIEGTRWIPRFEALVRKNPKGSAQESRYVLANATHYMQFFNIAFEQMVFDQIGSSGDRKTALISQGYRDLDRASLRVLCDAENLVKLLDGLEASKQQLARTLKANNVTLTTNKDSPKGLNLDAVESMARRLRYSGDTLESAFWASAGRHRNQTVNNNATALFVPLARTLMPKAQRNLQSDLERKSRDNRILSLFDQLLGYYESVLTSIYL